MPRMSGQKPSLALSLLLACVFWLGQSAPLIHHALQVHRVCAAHGGLVHADDHDHHASEAGPEVDPKLDTTQRNESSLVVGDGAADHGHEHCSGCVGTWASIAWGRDLNHAQRVPIDTTRLPDPSLAVSASVALYLLAPKTSPPQIS